MSWGFTVLLTKAGAAFLEENGAEILEGDGKYLIPSEYRYFSSYKLRDGRIVHARVPYGSAPFFEPEDEETVRLQEAIQAEEDKLPKQTERYVRCTHKFFHCCLVDDDGVYIEGTGKLSNSEFSSKWTEECSDNDDAMYSVISM